MRLDGQLGLTLFSSNSSLTHRPNATLPLTFLNSPIPPRPPRPPRPQAPICPQPTAALHTHLQQPPPSSSNNKQNNTMTISTPKPTPTTLTLRLKFHRTTVLLHADPLLSSSALQSDLLHALHDTHPDSALHGRPLPSLPTALQIARLVDPTDVEQGWVELTGNGGEEDDNDAETPTKKTGPGGRPKGKEAKDGSGGKSLKELGVKDGMVLAFRWTGEVERDGEVEVLEWEDWDVVWPRYEDTYGLEDEGIVE